MQAKIEINTKQYEFAHGNLPHGYGHWAFYFDFYRDDPFWVEGQYGDAKKTAIAEAKRRGKSSVTVGS